MTTVQIVRATPADIGPVAGLIGEEFHGLRVAEWLVPDPGVRAQVLAANFGIHVEHAVTHGVVELTVDRGAVAVWFPVGFEPVPPPADYDARLAAASGSHADRFRALDAAFEAHHPHDPHHYLAFMAVRRDLQGRGLGSVLLRRHHQRLDETGVPAYLEASSQGARALYKRHGYRDVGEPFDPAGGEPSMWPMWRDPVNRS